MGSIAISIAIHPSFKLCTFLDNSITFEKLNWQMFSNCNSFRGLCVCASTFCVNKYGPCVWYNSDRYHCVSAVEQLGELSKLIWVYRNTYMINTRTEKLCLVLMLDGATATAAATGAVAVVIVVVAQAVAPIAVAVYHSFRASLTLLNLFARTTVHRCD